MPCKVAGDCQNQHRPALHVTQADPREHHPHGPCLPDGEHAAGPDHPALHVTQATRSPPVSHPTGPPCNAVPVSHGEHRPYGLRQTTENTSHRQPPANPLRSPRQRPLRSSPVRPPLRSQPPGNALSALARQTHTTLVSTAVPSIRPLFEHELKNSPQPQPLEQLALRLCARRPPFCPDCLAPGVGKAYRLEIG